MESIQIKKKLKKKKKILSLINHISSLDETTIKFFGNREDLIFKKIELSFEEAIAGDTKLPSWILNMNGLSGKKFRILINNLIEKIKSPKYLEIGSWTGSTSCSACFKNNLEITCIDNWSQNFSSNLDPKVEFKKNIQKCISNKSKLHIVEKDFKEVNFKQLKEIFIYFYDGAHHYEDHFDSIKLVLPALCEKFIMIVDDWNWIQVRQGTLDAFKKLKLKTIAYLEIKTTNDDSSALITGQRGDWHQGCAFFVLQK